MSCNVQVGATDQEMLEFRCVSLQLTAINPDEISSIINVYHFMARARKKRFDYFHAMQTRTIPNFEISTNL